jgi:hypothetical protein
VPSDLQLTSATEKLNKEPLAEKLILRNFIYPLLIGLLITITRNHIPEDAQKVVRP